MVASASKGAGSADAGDNDEFPAAAPSLREMSLREMSLDEARAACPAPCACWVMAWVLANHRWGRMVEGLSAVRDRRREGSGGAGLRGDGVEGAVAVH